MVDAAHIIPVDAANNDHSNNGIALCALHHRAYDRSLITMDDEYFVMFNPDRLRDLEAAHRNAGWAAFRSQLKAIIDIPPSPDDRPSPELIRRANVIRGWKRMVRVA